MARGDIWEVWFPAPASGGEGHEQIGRRPALVIEVDAERPLSTVMVVPMTSNLRALSVPYTFEVAPSPENGLQERSVALVMQLRAIDRKRLQRKLGRLEPHYMTVLEGEVKHLLGLF